MSHDLISWTLVFLSFLLGFLTVAIYAAWRNSDFFEEEE